MGFILKRNFSSMVTPCELLLCGLGLFVTLGTCVIPSIGAELTDNDWAYSPPNKFNSVSCRMNYAKISQVISLLRFFRTLNFVFHKYSETTVI
jgi:hypothetical protein